MIDFRVPAPGLRCVYVAGDEERDVGPFEAARGVLEPGLVQSIALADGRLYICRQRIVVSNNFCSGDSCVTVRPSL